jgi:hypothetical protein
MKSKNDATQNDADIIEPPTHGKNKAGGKYNGGYPSMREMMNRPNTGDLSSKKLMIVGSRGGAAGFVQSSGGASEEIHDKCGTPDCCQKCDTGKSKMTVRKMLEKSRAKLRENKDYFHTREPKSEYDAYVSLDRKGLYKNKIPKALDNPKSDLEKPEKTGYDPYNNRGRLSEREEFDLNEAGIEMAQDNDPKYSRDTDADRINYQFDNVFRNKFSNPYLIVNAVAAILERFSIKCPVINPSGRSEIFVLHIRSIDTDAFVYIAIERDGRGQFDAFVQLVDSAGLQMLMKHHNDHEEEENEGLPEYPSHYILQQRHTGNI